MELLYCNDKDSIKIDTSTNGCLLKRSTNFPSLLTTLTSRSSTLSPEYSLEKLTVG